MELREIIAIFKKHQKTFICVAAAFVLIGIAAYFVQPLWYTTNLTLNVTRKGTQQTTEYRFDDFYRLQADERFADTVVRWLAAPRTVLDIRSDAKVNEDGLHGELKATRLSSQMIEVKYRTQDAVSGKKIAASIEKILNLQTEFLNKDQQEESWFKVLVSEPVTVLTRISFTVLFLGSLLLGIFLGAWAVMFKHYFK